MEVRCAQQKGSRLRGERQHLTVAVAGVLLLSGVEKRFSEVGPAVGIVRFLLQGATEQANGALNVLLPHSHQLLPRPPYQWRVIAEEEPAQDTVNALIV